MNYEKLDEVASKLESKYIPESAKGNLEAKEILAITQAYRIMRIGTPIPCPYCGSNDTDTSKKEVTRNYCRNCTHFF